ncbi:MAG: hypothetical protein P8J37_20390, partial [Fuerstiella sp.]|nr:hypothetical protein [Fuerstiella sp.]
TAIAWVEIGSEPGAVVGAYDMLRQAEPEQAWSWAERSLRRNPDDQRLLKMLRASAPPEQMSRLRSLLESKLDHRPVALHWHRTYQNMPGVSRDYEKTLALYETFVQADPQNSVLIYLRGRFDKNLQVGQDSIAEAIRVDPEFGWPYFSRGFTQLCAAKWQSAFDDFQLATDRQVPPEDIKAYRHTAMLGIGRLTELEQQYQGILTDDSAELRTAALLAEVLVVQGRMDDAEQIVSKTVRSYKEIAGEQHMESARGVQAMMSYFHGEIEACLKFTGESKHLKSLQQIVSMESGGASDFAAVYDRDDDQVNRWLPLVCSLSFHADDDVANSEVWYDRTLERLRRLGPRKEAMTRILSAETISARLIEELRLVHELPMDKAVILTCLGLRADSDDLRQQFFDAAQQLMVRRRPPYLLLQRIHKTAGDRQ